MKLYFVNRMPVISAAKREALPTNRLFAHNHHFTSCRSNKNSYSNNIIQLGNITSICQHLDWNHDHANIFQNSSYNGNLMSTVTQKLVRYTLLYDNSIK